jgi:predicted lipid-binding transport protein (Tim44 family)
MRKIFSLFAVALLSLGLVTLSTDANAKRFGGGSSFGKQRQITPRQAEPAKPVQAPATAPAPGGNRWLGPLAGLAAGGLLASLFMGHGFDGINFMDILLIALLAMGIMMALRALRRPAPQSPQPMQYAGYGEQTLNGMTGLGGTVAPPVVQPASTRPNWFQDESFLREAKAHFIRLQAAYDAGDLNDIREYTTPEVFAEISLQIQERGGKANKTEVVTLNAEMVDVASENGLAIASVRFSGLIREDGDQAAPFSEVWHIQKSLSQPNASWYVAGIQQD